MHTNMYHLVMNLYSGEKIQYFSWHFSDGTNSSDINTTNSGDITTISDGKTGTYFL